MSEPLREQVLVALVAKLESMTGLRLWGGAYPNPPKVHRKFKLPSEITQFPQLCVFEGSIDGSGSSVRIEVTVGGQVGIRHEYKVLLAGYVRGDGAVLASTWRERLWSDCLKTLMAENTLDGLVMKIDWVPEMETDGEELDPVALFVQPLSITFHETFTTD